ncbi:LysR substrate-binding domain-containing protein [Bosea vaviloviae]|nr:LysR substrate-binding domain-containing protein [Bosea vaviloviae]
MSFRRAGEELLITQSAVSHHIAVLERALGLRLFLRKSRGIAFTPEGVRYFSAINEGFATIARGTAELRGTAAQTRVRISLLPSFAANWLVPRLALWREMRPDIEIDLDPSLHAADVEAGEADLAIRYGNGAWAGVESRLLLHEWVTPVASPALLARCQDINMPSDLLAYPLLLNARPSDWEVWAREAGLDFGGSRRIQLMDYNIVLQAAIGGQGVAMGRLSLVADLLRAGTLVQPLPQTVSSPDICYWLITPRKRPSSPATRAVIEWLTSEVAAMSAPAPNSRV